MSTKTNFSFNVVASIGSVDVPVSKSPLEYYIPPTPDVVMYTLYIL